jgi:hypothetical protein
MTFLGEESDLLRSEIVRRMLWVCASDSRARDLPDDPNNRRSVSFRSGTASARVRSTDNRQLHLQNFLLETLSGCSLVTFIFRNEY